MTKVVNRFGQEVPVKIERIRSVLKECSEGLDVNLLELESHIDAFEGKETISTTEIQNSLIYASVAMCDVQHTDYSTLAARLLLHEKKRQALKVLGFDQYTNFHEFLRTMSDSGKYDFTSAYQTYSLGDLDAIESMIVPERDFLYDYAGANLLVSRYLIDQELPQTMFIVLAMLLAQNETDNRLYWVEKFYYYISTKRISLATPILSNLRKPNGSLSSCFITSMDDSLDSIFKVVDDVARISANGGGVGISISKVRGNGSSLHGNEGAAKGVIPWIRIINDTMVAVDQGGCVAKNSFVEILDE